MVGIVRSLWWILTLRLKSRKRLEATLSPAAISSIALFWSDKESGLPIGGLAGKLEGEISGRLAGSGVL
ncbi:MAG: hypothetical protein V3T85_09055 [Acidiferrobacterales bacterium]